jgi:hypothetical protein
MSAFLKNLPVKILGGTGVYLSEAHYPLMTPYPHRPLHTVYEYVCTVLYSILIHTGKGGGGRANQEEG